MSYFCAYLGSTPKTREGKQPAVAEPEIERPLFRLLPFVKAVSRDEAAPVFHRVFERRFFEERFRSRVDELVSDGRVLCPIRHQSPFAIDHLARARLADGGHILRRCYVEARRADVEYVFDVEAFSNLLRVVTERVSSAHKTFPLGSSAAGRYHRGDDNAIHPNPPCMTR